jgi:hypothetical protein
MREMESPLAATAAEQNIGGDVDEAAVDFCNRILAIVILPGLFLLSSRQTSTECGTGRPWFTANLTHVEAWACSVFLSGSSNAAATLHDELPISNLGHHVVTRRTVAETGTVVGLHTALTIHKRAVHRAVAKVVTGAARLAVHKTERVLARKGLEHFLDAGNP